MILAAMVGGVSNILLFCFFGKLATENFSRMVNNLFDSDWPNLPVKLQKSFILMIGNAQRPFYFHGLGLIVLNLESFASVRINLPFVFENNRLKEN